MPMYTFVCPECEVVDKRLLTPKQASSPLTCRKTEGCQGTLKRNIRPPSMVAKEVVDNGIMTRRVERDIDAERLSHERAQKDYRNRD
jgi:hypothetical protein